MIKQNDGNIMIALLAVVVLVGIGFWYVSTQRDVAPTVPTLMPTPSETTIDTSDWKTYTNEKYGFSVKYPNSWFIRSDSGRSIDISYQDFPEFAMRLYDTVGVTFTSLEDEKQIFPGDPFLRETEYFKKIANLNVGEPTVFEKTNASSYISVVKTASITKGKYIYVSCTETTTSESATEPFKRVRVFVLTENGVYTTGTIIPESDGRYIEALQIIDSFVIE
ncbi:hypothetical protein COY32_05670 [candidate division WWE3 bacterium CG_4_10_14_0_2_um_filter_41_14]|uniref:PsbP C-terminal domain-containing protein n=1 Tax=candidate division WWE3 bacterium CG_4_10_14_0_2_um_filter_41_14 TaxID=1975072 RepID=A0A2M7TGC2_UNCKA|nr:MAG: hypothetical protein COY32_05670 [candidate division WWE3 bacterium CG_4_10_14_0_2_um_filter_41_14]